MRYIILSEEEQILANGLEKFYQPYRERYMHLQRNHSYSYVSSFNFVPNSNVS